MNCPRCQTVMREREREVGAGEMVVMDVCPNCGGIWLDKGELENLTRLEDRYYAPQQSRVGRRDDGYDDDDDDDGGFGGQRGPQGRGGRRGGFLGGLFEGFGGDD